MLLQAGHVSITLFISLASDAGMAGLHGSMSSQCLRNILMPGLWLSTGSRWGVGSESNDASDTERRNEFRSQTRRWIGAPEREVRRGSAAGDRDVRESQCRQSDRDSAAGF